MIFTENSSPWYAVRLYDARTFQCFVPANAREYHEGPVTSVSPWLPWAWPVWDWISFSNMSCKLFPTWRTCPATNLFAASRGGKYVGLFMLDCSTFLQPASQFFVAFRLTYTLSLFYKRCIESARKVVSYITEGLYCNGFTFTHLLHEYSITIQRTFNLVKLQFIRRSLTNFHAPYTRHTRTCKKNHEILNTDTLTYRMFFLCRWNTPPPLTCMRRAARMDRLR